MTGEEFLRGLAEEIIATVDVDHWWVRFSSAFDALDLVAAIDADTARTIGEEIREGLATRSGRQISRFHLGTRRADRGERHVPPTAAAPSSLRVRAVWSTLPPSVGAGGTNFLSETDGSAWLVCSGAGPAPWPHRELRRVPSATPGVWGLVRATPDVTPTPDAALFSDVVDDRGDHYQLFPGGSSGSSDSGGKRQRWDLRAIFGPTPGKDVNWLEFHTTGGPVRAELQPPVQAEVFLRRLAPPQSIVEHYLADKLHQHVWLHLLDPERALARLDVIAAALVSVDAIDAGHPLVAAVETVDDAIAGGEVGTALPPLLAAALKADPSLSAWQQVAALGLIVDHPERGRFGLEALVGHPDRLAVHFLQGSDRGPLGSPLVVTATDDLGRGYVAHTELLGGIEEGAFHFRPPLHPDTTRLTLSLQGPSSAVDIAIQLRG